MKTERAGETVDMPRQGEESGEPALIRRVATYPWRPIFLALAVAGLLLLAGWQISRWYRERLLADRRAQVEAQLVPYGNALTTAINRRFALLDGLAAFAQTHPTEPQIEADFELFASGLYASAPDIRAFQIFGPDGPAHIYPLQGNEATIGRHLSDLINDSRPNVRADVQRTLETRRITLSVPYELRQGGLGLVGRLAVYREDVLWGLVVVVLDVPLILAEAGVDQGLAGLQVAVRDGAGGVITGPAAVFAAQPVSYRVTLPEGAWELAALPAGGGEAGVRDALWLFRGVMLVMVALVAALTYLTASREAQLAAAVRARTQELSAANQALEQEIVEHRQAAETLREKDALLRLTGEMGKIGGWEFDAETLQGTWTDEVETNVNLGISFYANQSLPKIEAAIQDALATGAPYDLELELITARGEHKWVRTIGRPIREGGQVVKVEGAFQDITDRKQTEEALRQSEERYRLLVDTSPYAIGVHQDGKLVFVNPAAVRIFRAHSPQDLIGKPITEIVHPEAWEAARERIGRMLVGETGLYPTEDRYLRLDGSEIPVEVTAAPFTYQGRPAIQVIALDITERKRAEDEVRRRARHLALLNDITRAALETPDLRTMLQTLADRLGELLNADGCYITLWDAAQQRTIPAAAFGAFHPVYTEYQPPQGEVTMTESVLRAGHALVAEDVFHTPFMSPRIATQFPARSLLGLPLIAGDQKLGAALIGFNRPHHFTADEIARGEQAAGQIVLAVAKAQLLDQVQRYAAELEQRVAERTAELSARVAEVEQLNHAMTNLLEDLQAANRQATAAAEQLKAANAELETFTYSVSHDLKAPLRGIDGYSRLLLEDYTDQLDDDGRRFLGQICRAAGQMNQLIDDLLTYSRLERRTINMGRINPAALAETLAAERAEEVRTRGVRLTVDVECTSATAEAEGLTQALRNLLDNALKFTRNVPDAAISIGGRDTASSCILWVADNGPGFDMRYHDRIFEIFQRLHRQEDYPGTGIGLAIVRKAMQRMGGRAWAESAPGMGATFYLEVPR